MQYAQRAMSETQATGPLLQEPSLGGKLARHGRCWPEPGLLPAGGKGPQQRKGMFANKQGRLLAAVKFRGCRFCAFF